MLANFVGLVVGVFVASRFYNELYNSFDYLFGAYESLGKIVSFVVLFSIISKLTSFGFMVFEKIFNLLSIIPFLKTFNKLGGAILGFFLGGIIIGLLLYLGGRHFVIDSLLGGFIAQSDLAPLLLYFAKIVSPLLPEALKAMKSLI